METFREKFLSENCITGEHVGLRVRKIKPEWRKSPEEVARWIEANTIPKVEGVARALNVIDGELERALGRGDIVDRRGSERMKENLKELMGITSVDDHRKSAEMIPIEGLSDERPLTDEIAEKFFAKFRFCLSDNNGAGGIFDVNNSSRFYLPEAIPRWISKNFIPKDKVREIVEKAALGDPTKTPEQFLKLILKEFNLDS